MIKRVDERECGGTVEGSTVIEGGGDVDRGLVDVWYAEVDLPHDAQNNGEWDFFMQKALHKADLACCGPITLDRGWKGGAVKMYALTPDGLLVKPHNDRFSITSMNDSSGCS